MKDLAEKNIIDRVLMGDQSACTAIVNKYSKSVLVHITSYISRPEDAEDICQETFRKCFMNIGSYNPDYAFSTWLYTIAENNALDFYRKKRIQANSSDNIGNKDLAAGMANVPSPEEYLINEEEIGNLVKSIKNLNITYRKVAELRFIHEYPMEEISKKLNLPLNTVKTRVSRARKILIEEWKN